MTTGAVSAGLSPTSTIRRWHGLLQNLGTPPTVTNVSVTRVFEVAGRSGRRDRWRPVCIERLPKGSAQLALPRYMLGLIGAPYGIRTRVSALRGPRPGPLDEGSEAVTRQIVEGLRPRNPGRSGGLSSRHPRQHARHERMHRHIGKSRALQIALHLRFGVSHAGAAIDRLVEAP